MRPFWFVLLIIPVVALVMHLTEFSREEVDRVEIHAEGAPPLLLVRGQAASVHWSPGKSVVVAAFIGKTEVCEGTVSDTGMGLIYRQRSQTKSIEVNRRVGDSVELSLTNVDMKTGQVSRQVFLDLERRGAVLECRFPGKAAN